MNLEIEFKTVLLKWLYAEFFNLHSSSQTMVKIPVHDRLLSVASGNVYIVGL